MDEIFLTIFCLCHM